MTSQAYEAVRALGGDVGNLRVSKSAVELDLLLDSKTNLDKAVQLLEETLGLSLTIRQLDFETLRIGSPEAVRAGLDLFNEERYWESHEALEVAWRKAFGDEKEVLQGIILLAAALVHLQKNEPDIALSVMKRAYAKLAEHHGEYFGIDTGPLNEKVSRMLSTAHPVFFKIDTKR